MMDVMTLVLASKMDIVAVAASVKTFATAKTAHAKSDITKRSLHPQAIFLTFFIGFKKPLMLSPTSIMPFR